MNIGDICSRAVVSVRSNEPVHRAAELMRQYHVGSLVVTDGPNHSQQPLGMVTDRDIVIEIVAKNVDPGTLTVGDVMSADQLIAEETDELDEVLEDMRAEGVRRIPVVDEEGMLVGVFALDDLLQLMATQLDLVAGIVGAQRVEENRMRA